MALRSKTSPIGALRWFRKSDLFSDVRLKDWNEENRRADVWGLIRPAALEGVWEAALRDVDQDLDTDEAKSAAVARILGKRAGCPAILALDLESTDEDETSMRAQYGTAMPRAAYLYLQLQGREPASKGAEKVSRSAPRRIGVQATWQAKLLEWNRRFERFDDDERGQLGAVILEDRDFYLSKNRGRNGYVMLVSDPDDPTWEPTNPNARKILEVAESLRANGEITLKVLASRLNSLGLTSLHGAQFTEASVTKVVIALELWLGSRA